MSTSQIPEDVAVAIKACWPDGVVQEFTTDESYFHEIHPRLERDLRNVRGASLLWRTEEEEIDQWQSYYVFFLAPDGKTFHFEDETTGMEEPDEPEEEEWAETTYPGEGWIGCAVGISLAAPYAVINLSSYSRYEDGTMSSPDVESFIYSDKTGDRIDTDQYHR